MKHITLLFSSAALVAGIVLAAQPAAPGAASAVGAPKAKLAQITVNAPLPKEVPFDAKPFGWDANAGYALTYVVKGTGLAEIDGASLKIDTATVGGASIATTAAGKPAWGLPVAADDATPVRDLFPYSYYGRHFGGYFLRTPEGPVHLVGGRIEPPGCWPRSILRAERRTVDLDAWRRAIRASWNDAVAPLPEAPYEPSSADAALPVQLFPDPDATFASLTNAVLRLRAAGFENLFIETLPH